MVIPKVKKTLLPYPFYIVTGSFGLIAALSLFYYYEFEEDPTMSSEIKMITTEDTNGVTAALSKFSTSLFKVLLVYIYIFLLLFT